MTATTATTLDQDIAATADRIMAEPTFAHTPYAQDDIYDLYDQDADSIRDDALHLARLRVTAADTALTKYHTALRDGIALARALAPAQEAATGRPVTHKDTHDFVAAYAVNERITYLRAEDRVARAA